MNPTAIGTATITHAQRQSLRRPRRMAFFHYMARALPRFAWLPKIPFGGMGERPKPPVLKTGEAMSLRGFESPSLR